MTDKVFFTLNVAWTDPENGIFFIPDEIFQGVRNKAGIKVTGLSSFEHIIPWEFITEQHLKPKAK